MEQPTSISSVSDPWYVVYCKPRREFYAANVLRDVLEVTTYLPEIEINIRKKIQKIPFFLGYFFIQTNLQKVEVSRINSSPGVLKLLDFGNGPLNVPQELIEAIREEIDQCSTCDKKLSPGDPVRVTNGPFEGLRAIFVESLTSGERARVLLHFLGRLSRIQVDAGSLEKLGTQRSERMDLSWQERRTRGRGRRINRTIS